MTFFSLLPTTWSWSKKNGEDTSTRKTSGHPIRTKPGLTGLLQFLFVTGILCVVGSRVASLVVLEFCLRAVSGLVTAGPVRNQLCDKKIYMNMPQLYKVIFLWLTLLSWCQDESRQPSSSALIHSSLVLLFFPRSRGNFCSSC